jgi:hypothetical protein
VSTRRIAVVTVTSLVALLVTPLLAAPSRAATSATAAGDVGARVVTRALTRAHLNADGTQSVVDRRTVTLRVAQTQQLHSRQPIRVSWTGAHPTGGIVADSSSSQARLQEYPFVLLECRGVDSTAVPLARRLRPETCWTQSVQERFQRDASTGFPAWRVDRRAVAADRRAVVGAPAPRPAACGSPAAAERWLPFVSAGGATYNTNLSLCGSQAPEASNVSGGGQPSNTTYAITQKDGSGSTKFTTWTQEDNASLGCQQTVACSLVAVPVMGISCDESAKGLPAADRPSASVSDQVTKDCRATGSYAAGAPNQNGAGNAPSVSGALWWSASNWSGRIVVPLSFAPPTNVCDIAGGKSGIDVYGSELLVQATTQWRPSFCLGRAGTPFKHVQVGEPQAKSLLSNGTITGAFVSNPPAAGWSRPVVNAPTAITGFSISYAIDDAQGEEYTRLKLTPRLLAKLLTQSYPALTPLKDEYTALSGNPLNLTLDPEFQALNPGITRGVGASAAASELFSLSSDSDVVHALTSYLNADKDARAFLDGTPDPWGMVVNPSYAKIALPVDAWPERDTFEPAKYYASGQNECLQANPVPFLPLVSAPTARMAAITLALQFALSNSQIDCVAVPGQTDGVGSKLVAQGRQQPGFRFLIGVTPLGDAQRYALRSAALQAKVEPGAAARFTSDAGRAFVAPDDASLAAAARLLVLDPKSQSWKLPPAAFASSATAYPGTMPVYTSVATTGLSAGDAAAYAALLRFVAGPGQVAGLGTGQLPPGYLPLTRANGLGPLVDFTLKAAASLQAQAGVAAVRMTTRPPTAAVPSSPPAAPGTATVGLPVLSAAPPAQLPALVGSLPPLLPQPVALALANGITPTAASQVAAALLPALVALGLVGGLVALAGDRWSRRRVTR